MTKTNSDWYLNWFNSPFYHQLYKKRDYNEATFFMSNLLKRLKVQENSSILDLACGRGRYSQYLSSIGYDVVGIDISLENIVEAKKSESNNLNYLIHDMRNPLKIKFDLILNLFTSFGYYENDNDNLRVIKSIKSNLNTNGKAVIDFLNIDYVLENIVKNEEKIIDNTKFTIKRYLKEDVLIKEISVISGNKSYEFQEKVKAYRLEDFSTMLKKFNLEIIETFGDYKLNPFNKETSPRLIMILK